MQRNESQLPRLLLIDDSDLIHRLVRARLKHERIEIRAARSGAAGIDMTREWLPDVILLDIDMPGIDGFDVLRELKADPHTQEIPVIFISGAATTESKVRGLEMGAIDFVSKPFDVAELKARLRSALRIRQLIKMLAQRAQLDGLTGLWNRAYFNDRLEAEITSATRHETPLSLVMCDLDQFKQLNDGYGHPFGDSVLEEFSRIIAPGTYGSIGGGSRGGDIACRYGGEEFAIIVPHTPAEEAELLAERIRRTFHETVWDGHPKLEVTASFGVADLDRAAQSTSLALLEAADQALYAAKSAGRNSVVLAPLRKIPPQARLSG